MIIVAIAVIFALGIAAGISVTEVIRLTSDLKKAKSQGERKVSTITVPVKVVERDDTWDFAEEFSHADMGWQIMGANTSCHNHKDFAQLYQRWVKTFAHNVKIHDNGEIGYVCYHAFDERKRNMKPKIDEEQ